VITGCQVCLLRRHRWYTVHQQNSKAAEERLGIRFDKLESRGAVSVRTMLEQAETRVLLGEETVKELKRRIYWLEGRRHLG